jgi:hypothetical protein
MTYIDTGIAGVTVEKVETLYAEFERMDVPAYYHEGGENPYAGRCRVIPQKATYYTMIPARDAEKLEMARLTMKGIARRRKVREVMCEKAEVNFNQFVSASRIVVLYV